MRKHHGEPGTFPFRGWGSEGHSPAWPGLERLKHGVSSLLLPLAAQNSTSCSPAPGPLPLPGPSRRSCPTLPDRWRQQRLEHCRYQVCPQPESDGSGWWERRLQIRVWVGDTQCPEVRDRRQEGWHFPFDTHSGSWTAELIQPLKIAKEFETCSPQPDRPRLRLAHARSHTCTHIPASMNSTTAQSM